MIRDGRGTGTERLPRLQPRLQAAQVARAPLDVLVATFGGSIHLRGIKTQRRPIWNWERSGAAGVAPILDAVLPYLMVKREEGLIVREFCELMPSGHPRPRVTRDQQEARNALAARLAKVKVTGRGVVPVVPIR